MTGFDKSPDGDDDRDYAIAELCDVVSLLIYHLTTHGPGDDEAIERAERVVRTHLCR